MSGSGGAVGDSARDSGGRDGGRKDWRSSPFLTEAAPKLGVGWAVRTTFVVLRRNPVPLGLLGLLFAGLPNAAIDAASLPALLNAWLGLGAASAAGTFLVTLPTSAAQALLTAGATAVVAADLRGQLRMGFGASLATLPRLALPVMGLNLVAVLCVAVGMVVVVPGIVLLVKWMAALPARAVEGPGIGHAFERSADLVRGNFWRCAALGLAYAAVVGGVGGLAVAAGLDLGSGTVGILADAAWMTAAGVLQAVGCAVAYVGLSRIKDGEEPAQVSAVFS